MVKRILTDGTDFNGYSTSRKGRQSTFYAVKNPLKSVSSVKIRFAILSQAGKAV